MSGKPGTSSALSTGQRSISNGQSRALPRAAANASPTASAPAAIPVSGFVAFVRTRQRLVRQCRARQPCHQAAIAEIFPRVLDDADEDWCDGEWSNADAPNRAAAAASVSALKGSAELKRCPVAPVTHTPPMKVPAARWIPQSKPLACAAGDVASGPTTISRVRALRRAWASSNEMPSSSTRILARRAMCRSNAMATIRRARPRAARGCGRAIGARPDTRKPQSRRATSLSLRSQGGSWRYARSRR